MLYEVITDPYQQVMEWWNTGSNKYTTPAAHLFELMNITPIAKQSDFTVGKGHVWVMKTDPKSFVMQANGDSDYIQTVVESYASAFGQPLQFKNHFYLQRGAFDIVSVMNEDADTTSFSVKGPVIDLFDPTLPVFSEKKVNPGTQAFLVNLNRIKEPNTPQILASAARIFDEHLSKKNYSFTAKSPLNTTNAMRVLLPNKPTNLRLVNAIGEVIPEIDSTWDENSHTYFISFENSPDGVKVDIKW